ncbi:murein hydrolase activator EnvC [Legionella sp. W05-934-2]|jgi:septal ring factor EnvC (AmiA/AmiB activator)|uniref:murein hydrolase activator EnvC family protein n=1 Tax=Legionella sp. W05-934-2 TaxID=1198649 RepID=UPI003461B178
MMLKYRLTWTVIFLLYGSFGSIPCYANKLSQTKQQLAQLDKQIRHTEKSLNQAKQKRSSLQTELSIQDKKIGQLILQKGQLDHHIRQNNESIIQLSQQIKKLNEQIEIEQKGLSQQIRSRYLVDTHQPIKWLLSPGSKRELSQILTYYQYLIHAQQASIQSIHDKKTQLNKKKTEFNDRIAEDKQLQENLSNKQSILESTQKKQHHIINQLTQTITSQSQQLKEYKDNQAGLSHVIDQLTKQDKISQRKPFASKRHHLPRPVPVMVKAIKPINQGLAFFAQEGTAVTAIHPGKIVFSDWLKGYGLLLIIDHGHGYMTLYAHNQALTKRKGEWVDSGEKIAEVGHSGGLRENGLYFEIRHHGKAISPINWLS